MGSKKQKMTSHIQRLIKLFSVSFEPKALHFKKNNSRIPSPSHGLRLEHERFCTHLALTSLSPNMPPERQYYWKPVTNCVSLLICQWWLCDKKNMIPKNNGSEIHKPWSKICSLAWSPTSGHQEVCALSCRCHPWCKSRLSG